MSVAITAPADLLRIADLSAAQLDAVLELAGDMRDGPGWWTHMRPGGTVALLFDGPYSRTRASFEDAAHRLGMLPIVLRPDEPRLGMTLSDAVHALPGHAGAIVARTSRQAVLEDIARMADVPVVNAGSDAHHPSQALADLLTIRRWTGYLDGLRIAYVGGGGSVAHSLMEAAALAGMHVALATPPGREPDRDVVAGALALAADHGGSVRVGHDPRAAAALADVVYGDAWEDGAADMRPYRVDAGLMHYAAPGALFLHRRPERRDDEVAPEVFEGHGSLVREQAANRLPTAQALLHVLVLGDR